MLYKRQGFRFWEQPKGLLIPISALGIGLMAVIDLVGGYVGRTLTDIPASLGYLALVILLYQIASESVKALKEMLLFLCRISYELFLVHMAVANVNFNFVFQISSKENGLMLIPVLTTASIIVAAVFQKSIEWSKDFTQKAFC